MLKNKFNVIFSCIVLVSIYLCVSRLPALFRSYGTSVKSWSIVYRLRVYELLALLPPQTYQGNASPLILFCTYFLSSLHFL